MGDDLELLIIWCRTSRILNSLEVLEACVDRGPWEHSHIESKDKQQQMPAITSVSKGDTRQSSLSSPMSHTFLKTWFQFPHVVHRLYSGSLSSSGLSVRGGCIADPTCRSTSLVQPLTWKTADSHSSPEVFDAHCFWYDRRLHRSYKQRRQLRLVPPLHSWAGKTFMSVSPQGLKTTLCWIKT